MGSQTILLPENNQIIKNIKNYEDIGGLQGLKNALNMKPTDVIETLKKAGLRGRGGAGFPTFIKWGGVRSDPSPKKYVVCNGSEGEPGTYKDRFLLKKNPYPLVEGLLIAKYAIGATRAYIGLKAKYKIPVANVKQAILDFEKAGLCEKDDVSLFLGPDEYLFGEERGLLEVLSGGGAMPRVAPTYILGAFPKPEEHNPTVVNNIETFNHATHILAKGSDWFRSIGSEDTAGTTIFTLSGNVKNPGMYELPMGTPFNVLLNTHGGGPEDSNFPIKAVFSGVANPVLTPDKFETPLDFGSMKKAGSGLGSSGFIVFDEGVCMVEAAAIFSSFLARESCGQCMPCKIGCQNISSLLWKIHQGKGSEKDMEAILLQCGHVTDQTRCFLSHEEKILMESFLTTFKQEFLDHLGKKCTFPKKAFLGKIDDFDEKAQKFHLVNYPQTFMT
ncbi:hypothetical protein AB834_02660 [PVC group bacterium (ex Bugula neritina AB1)]|nr:hypothetical protein AB834_02660 [PVC group bacterium (ex Bugula neritina AB1)]